MKLYYAPGASSLASHISLREAGLTFDMEKVDLRKKTTETGNDFYQVTIKGAVPALQLDDNQVLTEGSAILQYIADLVPSKKLAPSAGTIERYRLMEWLNLIATELHKNYSPLFNRELADSAKEIFRGNLKRYYDVVEKQLSKTPFLLGDTFSVADAYLFTVTRYAKFAGLDIGMWPSLQNFQQQMFTRPSVIEALKFEGL